LRGRALQAARRASTGPVAHWQRLEAAGNGWDSEATLAPLSAALPASFAPDIRLVGTHPLADARHGVALRRQAEEIEAAFAAIEPTLHRLAPLHFDENFPQVAVAQLRALGLDVSENLFAAHVTCGFYMHAA
jgi:hypothetical protein